MELEELKPIALDNIIRDIWLNSYNSCAKR